LENDTKKIGVIGAGGWGTTLAMLLAQNGHDVRIWTHEKAVIDEINQQHTNSVYLKGVIVPHNIMATDDPDQMKDMDLVLIAVPTQFIRSVLTNYNFPIREKLIVNVSKGIEKVTLYRISEIIKDVYDINPDNYVVLTGPSHAEEVSRQLPTTVVAASENHDNSVIIQNIFKSPFFRVYTSDDVIGCEVGGAIKNVIAVAAGVIDGLGLGDNTKAALITRGLAGMSRLGVTLGANILTFQGLSGLGDLFVTCASKHSRNRFVGEQIGKGKKLPEIMKDMQMVAEGVHTTESAFDLGKKFNVELPITEQMHKVLFEDLNPMDAIRNLMTRQSKREWWW
jgi:glycerol-3-phosphate dehydrogenase (NAD(P)+)